MPYTGRNWPNVNSNQSFPYQYDFSDRLPVEDDIESVEWSLTVAPNATYTERDPDPNSHLSQQSFGGQIASVWIRDLVTNVRYKLTATIASTSGVKDDLYSYIQCEARPTTVTGGD